MLVAGTRQDALRSVMPGRAGKAQAGLVGPRPLSPKEGGGRCSPTWIDDARNSIRQFAAQPSAADVERVTN
jgi:hypothetical protein